MNILSSGDKPHETFYVHLQHGVTPTIGYNHHQADALLTTASRIICDCGQGQDDGVYAAWRDGDESLNHIISERLLGALFLLVKARKRNAAELPQTILLGLFTEP